MRPFYVLTLLLLAFGAASAQPLALTFPKTPCDSVTCSSVTIGNPFGSQALLTTMWMRDSISYTIDTPPTLPRSLGPTDSVVVPICFRPMQRRVVIDSLAALVVSGTTIDTVWVRLSGTGVGPKIDADPTVLNFPKTNPGGSARMTVTLRNTGERTLRLTPQTFDIPPPFRLLSLLPVNIAPGDSLVVEVAFEPQENGVYPARVNIEVGCGSQIQLVLNGITDLIGTGAVLQLSKVGFNPVNNEQISCALTRCTDLTISNAGNAPLTIADLYWSDGTAGYTFSSPPTLPLTIPPNQQSVLPVCLTPPRVGVLRDTLVVSSNTRNSIAFGLVIDNSSSMGQDMNCNGNKSTRVEVARTQGANFIGRTLLYLPQGGVQDQIAIMSYGGTLSFPSRPVLTTLFPLTPVTEQTRADAQTSLASLDGDGGTTFTGAALTAMMDTLDESGLANRIIVLLSDGDTRREDRDAHPLEQVIARAKSKSVKIFTIGIPSTTGYLDSLARLTGGIAFDANDCGSLQSAFETITGEVSKGTIELEPFSVHVTSPLLVGPDRLHYDTIRVYDTACQTLTLTNVGEGEAIISGIRVFDSNGVPTNEFYIADTLSFPLSVPQSEQRTFTICFNPQKIRGREASIVIDYNACGNDTLGADLTGQSYATADLRLSDTVVALPGDIVTLRINSDTALGDYEIKSIRYTVRWNKSMLDLKELRPAAGSGNAGVALLQPIEYDARDAVAQIEILGESITGSGPLAEMDFKMLRGDTLASPVVMLEGKFADGNPRLVKVQGALVVLDSTCFRDDNGIAVQSSAPKLIVSEATPTPAGDGGTEIRVSTDAPTSIQLELFTSTGDRVGTSERHVLEVGTTRLRLGERSLPDGTYFAIVRGAGGHTFVRRIVIAR